MEKSAEGQARTIDVVLENSGQFVQQQNRVINLDSTQLSAHIFPPQSHISPPPSLPIYSLLNSTPPDSELTFPTRTATPPTTTPTILTTSVTSSVSFVSVPYQLATKSRTTSANSAHTCRSISGLPVSGGSSSSSGVDGGACEQRTRRISASVGLSTVAAAVVSVGVGVGVGVCAGGVIALGGGGEAPGGRYPGMGGRAGVMA